jgi:hypothetical protein
LKNWKLKLRVEPSFHLLLLLSCMSLIIYLSDALFSLLSLIIYVLIILVVYLCIAAYSLLLLERLVCLWVWELYSYTPYISKLYLFASLYIIYNREKIHFYSIDIDYLIQSLSCICGISSGAFWAGLIDPFTIQ